MLKNRFFSLVTGAALIGAAACGGGEEAPEAGLDADTAAIVVPTTTPPIADPALTPMDTTGMGAAGTTDTAGLTADTAAGTTGTAPTTTP